MFALIELVMAQIIDGRRMFVCRFCTRPYTRRDRLHRHLRTVHSDEIEAEKIEAEKIDQNKSNIDSVPAKKARVGQFKCHYCENTYDNKYNRDLHVRSTHQGDVIRDAPVEFIGGGGRKRKTDCQHVRNVLEAKRPKPSEKAKKSIVICYNIIIHSSNFWNVNKVLRKHSPDLSLFEIVNMFTSSIFYYS